MARKPTKRPPPARYESEPEEESYLQRIDALIVAVTSFSRNYDQLIEQQSDLVKELDRLRRTEQQRIRQQRFREKQRSGRDERRYLDDVCPTCGT